jgi:hypothetical protein
MQFITAHQGKLQTLGEVGAGGLKNARQQTFTTGLEALDALAPRQCFARGAVHELLFDAGDGQPRFAATFLAGAACGFSVAWATRPCISPRQRPSREAAGRRPCTGGRSVPHESAPVIWSDPRGDLYPPALATLGFNLSRTFILRTRGDAEEVWAIAECLRCRGVGAVIAAPSKLSRIEARRLQLAAERGGSVGILLRQTGRGIGRGDGIYAAATRWKISPLPGERTIQRWTIQLLHGHGGRVGQSVILEWRREDHTVRAVEKLGDRQVETTTAARRRVSA